MSLPILIGHHVTCSRCHRDDVSCAAVVDLCGEALLTCHVCFATLAQDPVLWVPPDYVPPLPDASTLWGRCSLKVNLADQHGERLVNQFHYGSPCKVCGAEHPRVLAARATAGG